MWAVTNVCQKGVKHGCADVSDSPSPVSHPTSPKLKGGCGSLYRACIKAVRVWFQEVLRKF